MADDIIGAYLEGIPPGPCDRDAPQKLRAWKDALKGGNPKTAWQDAFGFQKAGNGYTCPPWAVSFFGLETVRRQDGSTAVGGMTWYVRLALNIVHWPLWMMDQVYAAIVTSSCAGPKVLPLTICQWAYGVVTRWTGLSIGPTSRAYEAAWNVICPTVWVDPGTAISTYLHDEIDLPTAKGFAGLSGWCEYTVDMAVADQQYRPGIGELVDWWHRGIIAGEGQLRAELRKIGVLNPATVDAIVHAGNALWDVGTIYRALHQLRPTRVPANLVYAESDARRDLQCLGYTTKQIDRMIYLAKADISHRQLLRPYEQGEIDDEVLRDYLLDDGYNEHDIRLFQAVYRNDKCAYQWRQAGGPSVAEMVKLVADGEMGKDVFLSELQAICSSDDTIQSAQKMAIATRQQQLRTVAIEGAKAGLRSGELDPDTAIAALMAQQVPADTAGNIVASWTAQFQYERKPVGPAQLCDWAGKGLLPISEYVKRLRRLGFSAVDTRRIIHVCDLNNAKKAETAAASAERKANAKAVAAAKQTAAAGKASSPAAAKAAQVAAGKALAAANAAKKAAQQGMNAANKAARDLASKLAATAKEDIAVAAKVGEHVKRNEDQSATGKLDATLGEAADTASQ